MKEILDGLQKWREDRNMQDNEFVLDIEVANILEEITEYLRAKDDNERIDALCDISVFSINALNYMVATPPITIHTNSYGLFDIYDIVGAVKSMNTDILNIAKCIYISMEMISDLGYDYKYCMLETIKEISSREQDPSQKLDWHNSGIKCGKWQKNLMQDPNTLYKADYESCKIDKTPLSEKW